MTTSNLTYLGFFCLLLLQLTSAAPAKDLPRYEPGVLYLPDKAIALGKIKTCYNGVNKKKIYRLMMHIKMMDTN